MLEILYLVVGIALFAGTIATKLQMEKEYKGNASRMPNKLFLYLDPNDFSERGNMLRKRYNAFYSVLLVYSIALFLFMKVYD